MRKDPKQILEAFSAAQKESRSSYERLARGRVDEHDREQTGGGGLIESAYNLESGHGELMDQTLHWTVRASMAQHIAQDVYHKSQGRGPLLKQYTKEAQITQGQTAENITELLKDPEKYGLTKQQEEELMDAAWFIHEGADDINPDKIRENLKNEKASAALANIKSKNSNIDSVSSQYGRARKKLANANAITDEEFHEARKKQTLSYFERLSDEDKKKTSNTDYDLRALELNISHLRTNGEKLIPEHRAQIYQNISNGVATSGGMIASGDGASLFKSGGDVAAGKLKGYATKKFISKATKTLVTSTTSKLVAKFALAQAPLVGQLAGYFLSTQIEKAIDKAITQAKKNAHKAGAALAALFLMVAGGAASVGVGIAMTILGVVIGVPVLLAIIIFIINSGGYIVPPGSSFIGSDSGFVTVPEGPGECPEGPAGWPVDTSKPVGYVVSQGPFTNGSHYGREAIDVANGSPALNSNAIVVATHPGKVRSVGVDSYGGKYVDIEGSCNGVQFRSRHVHFFFINSTIQAGVTVNRGQVLGIMGNTGYADKDSKHDHYEFRALESFGGGPFANSPIPMSPPYIPKAVARGCGDGTAPPCRVTLP